jgi:hypothetical protein
MNSTTTTIETITHNIANYNTYLSRFSNNHEKTQNNKSKIIDEYDNLYKTLLNLEIIDNIDEDKRFDILSNITREISNLTRQIVTAKSKKNIENLNKCTARLNAINNCDKDILINILYPVDKSEEALAYKKMTTEEKQKLSSTMTTDEWRQYRKKMTKRIARMNK